MEQVRGDLTGTGHMQEATTTRLASSAARMEEALAWGRAAHRHVWVAVLTHLVPDQTARRLTSGAADQVLFDLDSLATTSFGCMLCEQALQPGLIGGRCPGGPQAEGPLAEAYEALQRVATGSGNPSKDAADVLAAHGQNPTPEPPGRS